MTQVQVAPEDPRAPPVRRSMRAPGALAGLALACAAGACGPGSSEVRAAGSQDAAAGAPATDVGALPAPPARHFASQASPVGPEYDGLRARIDPAHASEAWSGEVVAQLTERAFSGGFSAALAGDNGPLLGLAAPNLALEGELRPRALDDPDGARPSHLLRDDGVARVLRVRGPVGGHQGHAELDAELTRLTASARAGTRPRVEVWVLATGTDLSADGKRVRPTARVRVRLAADDGDGGVQINLVLDVSWRVAQGGARLVRIRPLLYEEVRLARRAFRDATATALSEAPRAQAALAEDSLALLGRVDNVVPASTVALGMHGCAVGDVDGDGYEDLYVGRVAGSPNLLLMNGPGGLAHEEGELRGVDYLDDTGGVLIVDLDGDGARDIAHGRGIDVVIAWNDGQGRFREMTTLRHAKGARVYSLAAADFDGDGDLDLYDTRYFRSGGYGAQAPTPYHDATNGAPNHLWRNCLETTPRTFRDDTRALGLDVDSDRFSLSAVFEDFDGDGDLDLYVANDFGRNNLYDNQGERFVDIAGQVGLDDRAAGMGLSLADADLDGTWDLLVSNMWAPAGVRVTAESRFMSASGVETRNSYARHARGNSFFQGAAGGKFRDATESSGLGPAGWCWGARFVDWDRDGLADVVAPNGFLTGRAGPDLMSFFWRAVVGASPGALPATDAYLAAWSTITRVSQEEGLHWSGREPTFGYLNLGRLDFVDASAVAGLDVHEDGRALTVCDWDLDGRLDLWTKNRSAPLMRLMRGDSAPDASWIAFDLAGRAPNTDAVGALVEVDAGGVTRRARVRAGDGFLAGASLRVHFGLGALKKVDAVRVRWPNGESTPVKGLKVGALWRVEQPSGDATLEGRSVTARLLHGALAPMAADAVPLSDEPAPTRSRVPLLETFPLGALRLATYGAAPRRVDELAGTRGLAVLLWHPGVAESRAALTALAQRRQAFERDGLRVLALSLGDAREGEASERFAKSLELRGAAGQAERAARTAVDMLLARTLGPYDDLPLPVVLLFDPRGELGLLQVGRLDLDGLSADAATLAGRASGADARWPSELTGGHWAGFHPKRPLRNLAPRLREQGLPELADSLDAAGRERGEL